MSKKSGHNLKHLTDAPRTKHPAGIFRVKQIVALILIVAVTLPQMAFDVLPTRLTESPWLNLSEISHDALDFSQFDDFTFFNFNENENYNEQRLQSLLQRMNEFSSFTAEEQAIVMAHQGIDINSLAELTPEDLGRFLDEQEDYLSDHWLERETATFVELLRRGSSFSSLSNDEQDLVLRRLDIAYEALPIAEALFIVMERDGYSLTDSLELMDIIATGLFDYGEARAIFALISSPTERAIELAHFERFAQRFDIAEEINERRLTNLQFRPRNVFDVNGTGASAYEVSGLIELNEFVDFNGSTQLHVSRELVDISEILSANRPTGIHRFFNEDDEGDNQEWHFHPPALEEQPVLPEGQPPSDEQLYQPEEELPHADEQPDYADESSSESQENALTEEEHLL